MANNAKASMKAGDPRFQRSLAAIRGAVQELVTAKSPAELTITEVVRAANVTRPTFYQHFASVPEAARNTALALLDDAFPIPLPISPEDRALRDQLIARIKGNATPVLRHLSEWRGFYVNVLEGAGTAAFFEQIIAFLTTRLLPDIGKIARSDAHGDRVTILAGGLMWMVTRWLREETPKDVEYFADRLAEAVVTFLMPEVVSGFDNKRQDHVPT